MPDLPPEVREHVDRLVAAAPPASPELLDELRLIIWGSRATGGPREPGNVLPPAGRQRAEARASGAGPVPPGLGGGSGNPAAGADVPVVPAVYTADEAAAILKCTASWLKEQARRRKIPFTKIGGSYRWTSAHLEEIIRLGEHQPEPQFPPRPYARRPPEMPAADDVPLLQARTPRGPRKKPSG